MSTSRRRFVKQLSGVLLAPWAAELHACGGTHGTTGHTGGSDSLGDGGPTACSRIMPTIAANHGHTLDVPLADVQAGSSKDYVLSFNGAHFHAFHVTNVDFAALGAGSDVVIESGQSASHTHLVTLTCSAVGLDAGSTDAATD